jgi:hypothetical protein
VYRIDTEDFFWGVGGGVKFSCLLALCVLMGAQPANAKPLKTMGESLYALENNPISQLLGWKFEVQGRLATGAGREDVRLSDIDCATLRLINDTSKHSLQQLAISVPVACYLDESKRMVPLFITAIFELGGGGDPKDAASFYTNLFDQLLRDLNARSNKKAQLDVSNQYNGVAIKLTLVPASQRINLQVGSQ